MSSVFKNQPPKDAGWPNQVTIASGGMPSVPGIRREGTEAASDRAADTFPPALQELLHPIVERWKTGTDMSGATYTLTILLGAAAPSTRQALNDLFSVSPEGGRNIDLLCRALTEKAPWHADIKINGSGTFMDLELNLNEGYKACIRLKVGAGWSITNVQLLTPSAESFRELEPQVIKRAVSELKDKELQWRTGFEGYNPQQFVRLASMYLFATLRSGQYDLDPAPDRY